MIRVKVCGMRDPGNIRNISALQPDFMGFIFFPGSKRYFGNNYDEIRQITGSIEKVGVFVNEELKNILKIAGNCELDLIQLHGDESPEFCNDLRSAGFNVIKAFAVDQDFDFSLPESYRGICDYFLFDAKSVHYGGSGYKFNWDEIVKYAVGTPFFLSGGIEPGDEEAINSITNPAFYAVDINSRFETGPGMKDVSRVEKFINEMHSK